MPILSHNINIPSIHKHIQNGIIIGHLNICSIISKTLSLYAILQQHNVDIMSINETWLHDSLPNSSLFLPGYKIYRLDRQTHGGGVAFLVSNKYSSTVENTLITHSIELLHIVLELPSTKPINIITLYHPPSSNLSDFFNSLCQFLNNIDYSHLPLIILGDLNIDMLRNCENSMQTQLKAILNDYGLCFYGNNPTRITSATSTQIDLLIYNTLSKPYINGFETISTGISDHEILLFGYKKNKGIKPPPKFINHKSMSSPILDNIFNGIQSMSILQISDSNDVNHILDMYMNGINEILDNIPITKRRISSVQHPWITSNFIKLAASRDKLFHIAKKTNNIALLNQANALSNKCTTLSRDLKKIYISNCLNEHKNNPKKL